MKAKTPTELAQSAAEMLTLLKEVVQRTCQETSAKEDAAKHVQEAEEVGVALALTLLSADGFVSKDSKTFIKEFLGEKGDADAIRNLVSENREKWTSIEGSIPGFVKFIGNYDKLVPNKLLRCSNQVMFSLELIGYCAATADQVYSAAEKKLLISFARSVRDYLSGQGASLFAEIEKLDSPTDLPERVERLKTQDAILLNGPSDNLEEALAELEKLTGLQMVKQDVLGLVNLVKVQKLRSQKGMPVTPMSLHLVFAGNPGTGKTTVARLLARLYKAMGLLSKGHLVETDRSGLVAGYVGQTALKVSEVVKRALGGVLFIDEAYALTSAKGENDYGQEAVDTLLKLMEDHRGNLIVIVAGYTDLMKEFLQSNPGLQSRFNKFLHFEDYSP